MTIKECKKLLNISNVELGKLPYEKRRQTIEEAFRKTIQAVHPDHNSNENANGLSSKVNDARKELRGYYGKDYNPSKTFEENTQTKNKNENERNKESNTKSSTDNYSHANSENSNNSSGNSNDSDDSSGSTNEKKSSQSNYNQSNKKNYYQDYSGNQKYSNKKNYSYDSNMKESWAKRLFEHLGDAWDRVVDFFEDVGWWVDEHWFKLVFSTILLGIGGYFAYDKFIKEDPYTLPTENYNFVDNNVINQLGEGSSQDFISLTPDKKGYSISEFEEMSTNDLYALLDNYNNLLNQRFGATNISIAKVKDKVEYDRKFSDWYFDNLGYRGQNYDSREYMFVEKQQYTVNEKIDLICQLYKIHLEEYFRENISELKIGSLSDNLILNSNQNYNYDYAEILAYTQLAEFVQRIAPEMQYNYIVSGIEHALSNTGNWLGFREKTLIEVINKEFEIKANSSGCKLTERDVANSLFYSSVLNLKEQLENYDIPYLIGENLRYVDIMNNNIFYEFTVEETSGVYAYGIDEYIEFISQNLYQAYKENAPNDVSQNMASYLSKLASYRRYFANEIGELNEREIFKIMNDYFDYLTKNEINKYGLEHDYNEILEHRKSIANEQDTDPVKFDWNTKENFAKTEQTCNHDTDKEKSM